MSPNNDRFVAFLDILGMAELVLRDHAKAWELLGRLSEQMGRGMSRALTILPTNGLNARRVNIADHVRTYTFSDSVLAFTRSDTDEDLMSMFCFCSQLFGDVFHYCIPIRGAIAHGEFWFNLEHNLFSGPALVRAYQASEDPQWFGLTVDAVVAEKLIERGNSSDICDWEVPVKSQPNLAQLTVVNWPLIFRGNYQGPIPLTIETLYAAAFAPIFGSYDKLDDTARQKYVNTVAFFNAKFPSSP